MKSDEVEPGQQHDLALLRGHILHGEADRRTLHVGDHVDAFDVEPARSDLRSDIGLTAVIGRDNLDVEARSEILGGHLRRDHRALAVGHRRRSGDVGQDADLHLATAEICRTAGGLRRYRRRRNREGHTNSRRQMKA